MQTFLQEVNQGLSQEDWKITCYLFAPYAPQENPIVAIWLQAKNLLRKCYRFGKTFHLIKAMFELFINYRLFSFPDIKKYDAFSCLA